MSDYPEGIPMKPLLLRETPDGAIEFRADINEVPTWYPFAKDRAEADDFLAFEESREI
jgi:hypothetical protein